jgi:PIN domain nuclease of toxin-antitoxin system
MTYLIDTHVLIWYASGNEKLSGSWIQKIEDPQNHILISKASIWEIAIKVNLGKLKIGIPFDKLDAYLVEREIEELNFGYDDFKTMMQMPFHHRDPFDRLIISQAITNNLTTSRMIQNLDCTLYQLLN